MSIKRTEVINAVEALCRTIEDDELGPIVVHTNRQSTIPDNECYSIIIEFVSDVLTRGTTCYDNWDATFNIIGLVNSINNLDDAYKIDDCDGRKIN